MADLSMPACADNTTLPATEPSDLDVAIGVAQLLRDSDNAHALRESLRLLLRALDPDPIDEEEAARRFVARHFPKVTAFLADDRGERR
jgi:thiazole synthase ThiGH ThiG subunit